MHVTQVDKDFHIVVSSSEITIIREALRAYHVEMQKCGYRDGAERSKNIMAELVPKKVVKR